MFGLLSFVGGAGVLAVTEVVQLATAVRFTVREFAGVLVGIGLPAFLFGLVVLVEGDERAVDVSGIGTVLCALAVLAFSLTYPERDLRAGGDDLLVRGRYGGPRPAQRRRRAGPVAGRDGVHLGEPAGELSGPTGYSGSSISPASRSSSISAAL